MAFVIAYHPACLDDLKRLDHSTLRRIRHAIATRLGTEPTTFGKPLRHTNAHLWSLRVGDWRVIYQVRATSVLVLRIGHRREVYGGL